MIYGYIRVSTEKQTVENQRLVLNKWACDNNKKISRWIPETKSGTINPEKRKLGELINKAKKGDVIVVTELSRLGRSLTMIFNILQQLLDKGVGVIAIKEGYELTNSLVAKVLAFAFGISAEIERQMIGERTKAGLERARQNGKHPGRKKGQLNIKLKLSGHERAIKSKLKKGESISAIARFYKVKRTTVSNFILRYNLKSA